MLSIVVPCDDGDVRFITEETMGPLEVCVNKRWATMDGLMLTHLLHAGNQDIPVVRDTLALSI